MRQLVCLTVVLAMAATSLAQDWEGDVLPADSDLHGTLGVTWESEYVWRGFKVFGSKSATHVLADLNLWNTGFGVSAVGNYPNGSGYSNWARWDYSAYYQNGLFVGEPHATNFRVGWVLYDYPDMGSEWADLQEGHLVVSWPKILPVKGLCPTYVAAKTWASAGDSRLGETAGGWYHIFMLDYGFTVQGVLPDIPEHLIRLHGEIVYNDGANPYGQRMDRDWSHAVLGVATDVPLGSNITVTPAIYYQSNLEGMLRDHNNGSEELWASVGLKYSF